MRLFVAALLLAVPAKAQTALPDPAAVEAALDNHPTVVAAMARSTAARADARALAAGPHEFVASATIQQRRVERGGDFAEYDARLTRAIRLPGKAGLDRKAGEAGTRFAEHMAEDARHQAAVLLNDLWWHWVGAAGERAVLDRSVETLSAVARAVARRAALREASAMEMEQAKAALALAQAAARSAAGREAAARASLSAQFPQLPLPETPPPAPIPTLPAERLAALGGLVVARSHETDAAVAHLEQTAFLAERARRDRFADPSVGIRGFSEFGGAERGFGLLVSVPLGGSQRRAVADRARANASAAEAQAMAVRHDISALAGRDVATAAAAFAGWQEALRAADASASAAARATRGHALGGLDIADRLYAERLAQEAALAEAVARADAWRAITRLQIDSHTLWMHGD
jgi:outer membrane protein TolC